MSRRETPRALVIAGVALVVGLSAWLFPRAPHQEASRGDEQPEETSGERKPAPIARPALPPTAPEAVAVATLEVGEDGVPIMPARADAPRPEGPVHPHPITPAHQRIYRANRLVGALNGAMDVADVAAMRRLLQEYRDEYPEDDEMLQDGYAIVADCFEHPGEATRAAALRWGEEHRGSTLRRFVNRHCLER